MTDPAAIDVSGLLRQAGIAEQTLQAALQIDVVMQTWRRRAMKRELGSRALQDLKVGIDLPHLDVLMAIVGYGSLGNEDTTEVMVGTVAERLNIDPSRASRIVSEMVDQGFARRAASQADARRTIIELTPRGRAVVDAVRTYKYLIMGDFLASWTSEDVSELVRLLGRFGSWMDEIAPSTARHVAEIEALAQIIVQVGPKSEPA